MLNRYCLLDLETIASPEASQWLPDINPPSNWKDEAKIAAYVAEEGMKLLERAPLNPELCRIIAAGWQTEGDAPCVMYVPDVDAERKLLNHIWLMVSKTRPMVGYGLTWFDAGVLVRRSQLLDVLVPAVMYEQGKYRHPLIVELADRLTLNGMIEQKREEKKGHGLDYHCQRLGIQVEDAHTGKDVAELYAAGNVEGIKNHCLADIQRIRLLAERLRVISVQTTGMALVVEPVSTGAVF